MLVRLLGDWQASWPLAVAWASWIVLPWSLGALLNAVGAARRRGRRELATGAALAERTRLATEVHDIAGHAFALITMQAGVALLVFEEQPEQARRSLEAVRDTSSTALADLRRMLNAVHPRTAAPADPAEVAGLAELIDRVQAGGLPVTLTVAATARCRPRSRPPCSASSRRRSPTCCGTPDPPPPGSPSAVPPTGRCWSASPTRVALPRARYGRRGGA